MFYQNEHFEGPDRISREEKPNFDFPAHIHNSMELVTVLSGRQNLTIDQRTISLFEGESALIFPYQLHSFHGNEGKHFLYIFSPELVGAYINKYADSVPCDNKFVMGRELSEKLYGLNDSLPLYEKKGILYSVCSFFDKTADYEKRTHYYGNLLHEVFNFVDKNYAENCSLEIISKNLSFNYSYLSRQFKNLAGISFNKYINHYRINKATDLISLGNENISECAYSVGYKSLRSFNRNFKEIMGITPEEYRLARKNK